MEKWSCNDLIMILWKKRKTFWHDLTRDSHLSVTYTYDMAELAFTSEQHLLGTGLTFIVHNLFLLGHSIQSRLCISLNNPVQLSSSINIYKFHKNVNIKKSSLNIFPIFFCVGSVFYKKKVLLQSYQLIQLFRAMSAPGDIKQVLKL